MEHSKTYQYRKVMKPILERKRRARINKCLDDLKDLMVECLTQEGEHIVRLEKADILELTVDYLKKIKHTGQPSLADSSESFRSGYVHAANEVSKVLASTRGVDVSLGTTLMTHLGYRLNQLQTTDLQPVGSQQQVKPLRAMSPLKIELDHTQPMSPASSGYHSQPWSPVSSEDSFVMSSTYAESGAAAVWRPW